MPQLFLSHSSHDKPFVYRLASDLVTEDVPVWLDSWEIDVGDSLNDRIYSGISTSGHLAILLSRKSVESRWVKKELNAALAREDQLGRKFIVPIKVEECEVPLALADRIYVDFSAGNYYAQLEKLVTHLGNVGAVGRPTSVETELIAFRFVKGLFLEEEPLARRLQTIRDRWPAEQVATSAQVLIVPDENYSKLRSELLAFLDKYRTLPTYRPDSHRRLQESWSRTRRLERGLIDGNLMLINQALSRKHHPSDIATACHWLSLYFRQMILSFLVKFFESEDLGIPTDYACKVFGDPFQSGVFESLHGTKGVTMFDIWPEGQRNYKSAITVWGDPQSEVGRWFDQYPQMPDQLLAYWTPEFIYKYFFPQMTFKHVVNGEGPLYWTSDKLMIGCH